MSWLIWKLAIAARDWQRKRTRLPAQQPAVAAARVPQPMVVYLIGPVWQAHWNEGPIDEQRLRIALSLLSAQGGGTMVLFR